MSRPQRSHTNIWRVIRSAAGRVGGAFRWGSGYRPGGKRLVGIALVICSLAGIVFGISQTSLDTRTETFLPANDPSLKAVEQKAREFGGDPVVVLLQSKQPRQLLTDGDQLPRLLHLEGELANKSNVASVYGPGTALNQVAVSAQNLIARIGGRRDALRGVAEDAARKQGKSPSETKTAADAAVADYDQRYGRLLVDALPAGLPTLQNKQFADTVIFDAKDRSVRPQWKFVVPNQDTTAILVRPREGLDQSETGRLVSDVRREVDAAGLAVKNTSVSGVPVVTAGLADKVLRELPLLSGLVVLAVALRFLLVPAWSGFWRRMAPLAAAVVGSVATVAAFGLVGRPLSFGVVALLPVLLGVGSSIPLYVAMLRDTRRVLAMAVASSAGFFSLAVSPIPFVRELGIALGIGVLLTGLTALLLRRWIRRGGNAQEVAESIPSGRDSSARRSGDRLLTKAAITLLAVAVAATGWVVLPRLDVKADPEQLAAGLEEITGAQQAQRVLGSSGEVSVSLRGGDITSAQALGWARQAEEVINTRYGDQLRPVLTLPDLLKFLGTEPTAEQIDAAVDILPRYLTSAVLNARDNSTQMIFGVRLQDLGDQDRLLTNVKAALPPAPEGFEVQLVGLPVAAAQGYDLILGGRYLANIAGIAAAGLVLLVLLRRRGDALRAVAAGVLATGWSLTGIWLVNGALSPLTVTLGSLATVTGCEFSVLLADRDVRSHQWLRRSVALACLTSAIGYCALAASDLVVLREFGLVLTGTVASSYVAARLVLFIAPVGSDDVPDGSFQVSDGVEDHNETVVINSNSRGAMSTGTE